MKEIIRKLISYRFENKAKMAPLRIQFFDSCIFRGAISCNVVFSYINDTLIH